MNARALCGALALAFASSSAVAFELKGLRIGISEEALKEKFPSFGCKDSTTAAADRICGATGNMMSGSPNFVAELGSLADAHVLTWFVAISKASGAVYVGATLRTKDFDQVVEALAEKYGPAKRTKASVQNRMGATFENDVHTWTQGAITLTAERYGSNLENMAVTLKSLAAAAPSEDAKARSTKRAKDL